MKKILFLLLTLCSFSTIVHGDISWSAPTPISTALTNATTPHIVIDGNNNATSIWIENGLIKASSLPSGGSWSAPVTISNVSNTASNPKLAIDGSGNVTALWIENTLIISAIQTFGGSWGAAVTVSGSGASTPVLAVDSSGNAVAVWARGGFVESSTRVSGTWSLVAVISTSNSTNPTVAISDVGTAIAAWHSTSAGSDIIVTDLLTIASNTWAATKNVFAASVSFSHNYPKIAIDSSGNAVIAWFRYNLQGGAYQNVQILGSSLTAGAASWAVGTGLSGFGLRNPADLTLKLLCDSSGDAFLIWTNSYDGETFEIESVRKLFGGSWSNPIQAQVSSLYSFGIDVAISSNNTLLTNMAWDEVSVIQIISQQGDSASPVLQGFTIPAPVSVGDDNAYPKCALSTTGTTLNAVAVWVNYDGANTVIHAITGSETLIIPPSNVSVSQSVTNFGVYQDYYNTVTWNASSNPDIIQYDIYRNGVFFAATSPDTLSFVDHNATQGGTVTYGVAALLSNYRQSAIVSFTLN